MPTDLEKRFDGAMMTLYQRAKTEAGYNATLFLQMLVRDRGLLTAKKLINAPKQSGGYTALMLAGRLDLTVEALVVDSMDWRPLFVDEEIESARRRLISNGYSPEL